MKMFTFGILAMSLISGLSLGQSVKSDNASDTTVTVGTPEIGVESVMTGTLYSNGPYYNVEGSPNISLVENETLGMDTYGFPNYGGIRNADDFTIIELSKIESFQFYAYQTGSSTTSTINSVTLRIWDGMPGAAGSNVIWGDDSTNVLSMTEWTGAYRQLESSPGATNRPIMISTVLITDLELEPGTYWADWEHAGDLGSGPWSPPVTILGETTTGDALGYNLAIGSWYNLVDGNGSGGTGTSLGLPFEVNGEVITAGTNDLSLDLINIYPNPATNFLKLVAKSNIESISIYSLVGQEVLKISPKSDNAQVNISSLAKGTYLIKMIVNDKIQTQKFIKK